MAMLTLRDALLRGKRRPRRFGAGSPTMYRGDGYEFIELREYVPGDDVRRIDWAATARAGELQTRVVLEDVALTLAVMVDDTPSMHVGRSRRLVDAAHEAAQAWFAAARSGDRLLRIGSDCTWARRMLRSRRRLNRQVPSRPRARRCAAGRVAGHRRLVRPHRARRRSSGKLGGVVRLHGADRPRSVVRRTTA